MTHRCPARGCSRSVPTEELACLTHWRKLPWRMRINLNHSWRNADPAGHAVALAEAMAWYADNDLEAASLFTDHSITPPSTDAGEAF